MASPLGTIYSRADALKRQLYDMLTNPSDAAAMLGGRIVESGQQAQALQEQTFADPNRPFRVTDPQAMARLTDMLMAGPMGFAPAGVFIGPKSSLWDTQRALRAQEMEQAGIRPEQIWKETLTVRGPDKNWKQEIDISDIAVDVSKIGQEPTPISQVVSQRDLLGSYPQVFDMRVAQETRPGAAGSFRESENLVSLLADTPSIGKTVDPRKVMAHEVQHGIQAIERWPMGGNPESAAFQLGVAKKAATEGLLGDRAVWNSAFNDLVSADRALYMHKLQKLSVQSNVKPRQIFSLSDWYQYGSDYVRQNGSMPKKPGAKRDNWLNDAAAFIKQKNIETKPFLESLQEELPVQEAKNMAARANRKMAKVADKNKEFVEQTSKFKNLEKMSDVQKYERLYGEAEARLAQRRMPLSLEQRRENFPFRYDPNNPQSYGLDVPEQELFFYSQ